MPVIVCRVVDAIKHPNADKLRVYQVEAPGLDVRQVVANTTTVYDVGDAVAVALVGTTLADGTLIQKTRIRGELSFGMLLGMSMDPVGTDVTRQVGATVSEAVVDEGLAEGARS